MLFFKDGYGNDLQVVSLHTTDIDSNRNYAIIYDLKDKVYTVVQDLVIPTSHIIYYSSVIAVVDNLTEASQYFIKQLI